jgi:mRNA interferase YafQ
LPTLNCRGYDLKELKKLMGLLIDKKFIPKKYKDHALTGSWKGTRDAHIEPDWILIYRYVGHSIIRFERTGTHTELFGK